MIKILTTFIILITFNAYAIVLKGEGCAGDRKKALDFAVADLSSQIYVYVESEFKSRTGNSNGKTNKFSSYTVKTASSLPLTGYTYSEQNSEGCITAEIDTAKVLPLYMSELDKAVKELSVIKMEAEKADIDAVKLKLYSEILLKFDNYSKLVTITEYILQTLNKSAELPSPAFTKQEIEATVLKTKAVSSDFSAIATNIKNMLQRSDYTVSFVSLPDGSIPPFGAILTAELQKSIVSGPDILTCMYSPSSPSFIVSCSLKDGDTLKETALAYVDEKICKQTECYKAHHINSEFFTGTMYAHLYSNYGINPVALKDGDIIRLYLRINTECNVAVVNEKNGILHIIPLKNKLYTEFGKTMLNKEVELGILKSSGTGVERLGIIAYRGDLNKIFKKTEKGYIVNSSELNLLKKSKKQIFESYLYFELFDE